MLEGALQYLADCNNAKAKQVLEASIKLHMLALVRQNLAWYQLNGSVSEAAQSRLDDEFD